MQGQGGRFTDVFPTPRKNECVRNASPLYYIQNLVLSQYQRFASDSESAQVSKLQAGKPFSYIRSMVELMEKYLLSIYFGHLISLKQISALRHYTTYHSSDFFAFVAPFFPNSKTVWGSINFQNMKCHENLQCTHLSETQYQRRQINGNSNRKAGMQEKYVAGCGQHQNIRRYAFLKGLIQATDGSPEVKRTEPGSSLP